MAPASSSLFSPTQLQARACQWVGTTLIGLFLINLLGSFLPPQVLDPDWQLTLVGNLIDNGAYPLLGLLLIALGSYLEPDNAALQRRQLRWRALACWVSIAYLLLMPLIGLACKRGLDRASLTLQKETRNAQQAISSLRTAITDSENLAELQARFRQLQAPALPPDAASVPLANLKSGLLDRLESNDNALKENLRQPLFRRFLPILQKAFRNVLGCLVLAVGFAAVALPKGASRSQLQGWTSIIQVFGHKKTLWQRRWREWQETRQQRKQRSQSLAAMRRIQRKVNSNTLTDLRASLPSWLGRKRKRSSPKIHDYDYLRQISKNQRQDNSND